MPPNETTDTTPRSLRKSVDELKRESGEHKLRIDALVKVSDRCHNDVTEVKIAHRDVTKNIARAVDKFTDAITDLSSNMSGIAADVSNMKDTQKRDSDNINELFQKHDRDQEEEKQDLKNQLKRRHTWIITIVSVTGPLVGAGLGYLIKLAVS